MAEETTISSIYDSLFTESDDNNFQSSRNKFCESFAFGITTFNAISIAIGLGANSIALVVFRKFAQKSEGAASVALILTVLAIADMAFLTARIFVKVIPPAVRFLGGSDGLKAAIPFFFVWVWPLVTVAANTSLWITVVLTIHRYIDVCHPHKAAIWYIMERTRIYIITAVVSVIIYCLPLFFDDHLVKRTRDNNSTYMERVYTSLGEIKAYQLIYKIIMYQVVMYVVPNILLLILTIFLIRALIHSKKFRRSMKIAYGDDNNASESADDITKMLVLVVIVSLVCNLVEPLRRLLEFLNGGYSQCNTAFDMYIFEQVAALAPTVNASANFFICCWTGREFRVILKQLCTCGDILAQEPSVNQTASICTTDTNAI